MTKRMIAIMGFIAFALTGLVNAGDPKDVTTYEVTMTGVT